MVDDGSVPHVFLLIELSSNLDPVLLCHPRLNREHNREDTLTWSYSEAISNKVLAAYDYHQ